ncbi:MAG: transposase [Fidelibacterota bacterium]
MNEHKLTQLAEFVLPEGITDYFLVVSIENQDDKLTIALEEKNDVPSKYKDKKLESKGFYPPTMIQDFPIREWKVFLKIRCRKWKDRESGKVVRRDWQLAAKGTSITKEFASFLKEMVGYPAG